MTDSTSTIAGEPPANCALCPRLVALRQENQKTYPDWHNGPVPAFLPAAGAENVRLLIVGLAPGLQGANRTGRPFTGDYAGGLLYETLIAHGFASGVYGESPDDSLELKACAVTNAVRCLPPQNKPTGKEAANCRPFLTDQINAFPALEAIIALGRIAHDAVLGSFELRKADHPFGHNARHDICLDADKKLALIDSYHCSRYNTNTKRLTPEMFNDVFRGIAKDLKIDLPKN